MDPNERLTGIAQMAPEMMGAPPIDAASGMMNPGAVTGEMTQEQMMGGPPPEMMGGMGMDPEMMVAPPPEEGGMGGDESSLLAEAVMERTQGDIGAAINVLDEAKAKLMASADQDPMMANMGGPMYRNMGGPMYRNMGGPLYREDGGTMSDTDLLRQMIMSGLEGRTMSDNDMSGRTMSDNDMSGRTMSDVDIVQLLDDIRMAQGN